MSVMTTDLCDLYSNEIQICKDIFQSFGKRKRFCGPIQTVKVLEDNVLVKQALQTIPPGSVLVVDGGGSYNCALMGDNLANIAVERGLAGIVIYGCIRDSVALSKLDIGVLAIGKNPLKSQKNGNGSSNIPLCFGGVDWIPTHYVYADEDGVIIANRALT